MKPSSQDGPNPLFLNKGHIQGMKNENFVNDWNLMHIPDKRGVCKIEWRNMPRLCIYVLHIDV